MLLARLLAAAPCTTAAASRQSPAVWLISASPAVSVVAMTSFIAVALCRAAVMATNIVVTLVINDPAMRGAIALSERAIATVVAAPKLVTGAASAARVRCIAKLVTDVLQRLAEYAPLNVLVLLAFERTVVLPESL